MSASFAESPISDEQLALRAQQGCADSFEQLLRRFQTPVLRFLRRRGHYTDAEDLTQDTFIRAYKNLHRYDSRWAFSTWIFTIARRTSLNHTRRNHPMPDSSAITAAQSTTSAEPLGSLIEGEQRRRLWDIATEILSEEQNTALWLHYVEEMPLEDIAVVLGRTLSAVKVMLFRARKKLLPALKEFDNRCQPQEAGVVGEADNDE